MSWHVVYDAGALVAADKNKLAFLAEHRVRLRNGITPLVPAPVLAQAWAPESKHATLHLVLKGCKVIAFTEEQAREVARLCRKAGIADVVDGLVALTALSHRLAPVVTSDVADIRALLAGEPGATKIVVRKP
jgi:hypothetical protein